MNDLIRYAAAAACAAALSTTALAGARDFRAGKERGSHAEQFERLATFLVCENTSCDRDRVEETAAEIVAASEDGKTLIHR